MYENVTKLRKEFEKIKAKGYIKGICNNYSSIGRTFKNELSLHEKYLFGTRLLQNRN